MASARTTSPERASKLLELAVAARALPGETSSGDLHVVQRAGHRVLVGVLDALGHGEDAAAAARAGAAVLSEYAGEPLPELIQRCHRALIGTRGAVISLAAFDRDEGSMTWLGIGDVEGVLVLADADVGPTHTTLVTRGGIVGGGYPAARPWVIPVSAGDTLVITTDGIRSGIAGGVPMVGAVQQVADSILARGFKGRDDALVLVARYVGKGDGAT